MLLCCNRSVCAGVTTQPVNLWAETDEETRKLLAADATLVPRALLCLGSERDGILVGDLSPRLRLAIRAAVKFRVTQAVPWLISIYDDPTAGVKARDRAAEAAIRLDPHYSQDFLQDVMDDELLAYNSPELLSPAQRAAASALALFSDERANTLLLTALDEYLDSITHGGPESGANARNYQTVLELSRTANRAILPAVAAFRPKYPKPPASRRNGDLMNQLIANLQSADLLIRYAKSDRPDQRVQRHYAIVALGNVGDVSCVPIIEDIRRQVLAQRAGHKASGVKYVTCRRDTSA
jgi:hypothetical protein